MGGFQSEKATLRTAAPGGLRSVSLRLTPAWEPDGVGASVSYLAMSMGSTSMGTADGAKKPLGLNSWGSLMVIFMERLSLESALRAMGCIPTGMTRGGGGKNPFAPCSGFLFVLVLGVALAFLTTLFTGAFVVVIS